MTKREKAKAAYEAARFIFTPGPELEAAKTAYNQAMDEHFTLVLLEHERLHQQALRLRKADPRLWNFT